MPEFRGCRKGQSFQDWPRAIRDKKPEVRDSLASCYKRGYEEQREPEPQPTNTPNHLASDQVDEI